MLEATWLAEKVAGRAAMAVSPSTIPMEKAASAMREEETLATDEAVNSRTGHRGYSV
jgi:hypothetical protein